MAIGLKLPLNNSSKFGFFAMNETTLAEAKTRVLSLLQTNKGERLIHANLGTDIPKMLFEPVIGLKERIEENIRQAIEFWEPGLVIIKLVVSTENEDITITPNSVHIFIEFRIKGTELTDKLDTIIKS